MQKQEITKTPDIVNFGVEFQQQLIAEILTDHKFGTEIIEIIEPDYFKNEYFNFIIKLIKEYHNKHDIILNYIGLQIEIDYTYGSIANVHKSLTDTLEGVRTCNFNNDNVKKIALNFCKFQSVRNVIESVKKKLDGGYYDDYDAIEDSIRKAITFKEHNEGIDIFLGIENALDDNYRDVVPTGIKGLDDITNGGLGKGELAVIIAPLGVGKTTILTLLGSNAYQRGHNVLHIFFEDGLDEVRRKYLTHWSDIDLNELNSNKEFVLQMAAKTQGKNKDAKLVLVKLNADKVNIVKLRQIIKKEKSKLNGLLDEVIIDYADCIVGEQSKESEEWVGEGRTMRQLEGIADEFNVALWTAVQGGRKSTTAALVEVDMIGGNIKKAQVAHFIMSIAKTLPQRDQKLATIAILKSRFGGDGKVFENCTFNNSKMLIDTTSQQTIDMFDKAQDTRRLERVREVNAAFRAENANKITN